MSDTLEKTFSRELERLERRLDELVLITNQLKDENRSLRQRQDTLIAERATLLQKNERCSPVRSVGGGWSESMGIFFYPGFGARGFCKAYCKQYNCDQRIH